MDALGQLGGQPIDVRSLTNTAVSNVICSIIVGKRFDYEDTYFAKLLELLNEQVRLMATSNLSNIFPWLHYVPGDTFQSKKRMENYHYIRTFFCVHHIEKTENEFDEDNKDNFISAYLAEMKKAERQGRETTLNKENLSRVLLNLFGAGSETTSTTMLWFMVYMLHYPHIQNKVYREIEDVVGTERVPAMQDRPRLNYTNAVIMETQRLASIVPVGVPHYTQTEATVMGYTVPAGTTVLSNLDTVLWDGDTWENPMDFRPERFLDDQGKITQPEQFMPFSIGRRLCLGESMARMELYLFLAALVQRFEFAPEVPDQLPLRVPLDGITSPPVKFKIRFVDRRST
ncbi:cytochrome p450 2u1 [Plakobranchus ocellatus]|uniref:Cytochrome p450 2u1 n=1 Tax=Plakobranchus ocellatus TaxID=259542 RepID=A0AAV4CTZ2_9GAST|nr:cytochrome p450 2u1 [Plakobranchus ocellatus]